MTLDPSTNAPSAQLTLDKDGARALRHWSVSSGHTWCRGPTWGRPRPPFSMFKSVTVFILAQDHNDPCQLIRLWQNLTSFIQMISPRWKSQHRQTSREDIKPVPGSSTFSPPQLHFIFRNSPCGSQWRDEDKGWNSRYEAHLQMTTIHHFQGFYTTLPTPTLILCLIRFTKYVIRLDFESRFRPHYRPRTTDTYLHAAARSLIKQCLTFLLA